MSENVKKILLGNRSDWRASAKTSVDTNRFRLLAEELNTRTIELPYVDAILPLRWEEYSLIRQSTAAAAKTVVPTAENVELAHDKLRFTAWLANSDFGRCAPKPTAGLVSFPCILKKRMQEGGRDCHVIRNATDLEALNIGVDDPDYFLQPYISGKYEFVTHTMSVNGQLVHASTHRHTYANQFYVKGIAEKPHKTEDLGQLVPPEIVSILKLLGYSGCACFNFKIAQGTPAIFEMNPRVGGSFTMHINEYLDAYLNLIEVANAKVSRAHKWRSLNATNIAKQRITGFILRNWRNPGTLLRRLRMAWLNRR